MHSRHMTPRRIAVGGRQGRSDPFMTQRTRRGAPLLAVRAFANCLRLLPLQLRLAWMRWLRDELYVLHPGLPEVLVEIAHLEQEIRRA